jgi:hypothetical protein
VHLLVGLKIIGVLQDAKPYAIGLRHAVPKTLQGD